MQANKIAKSCREITQIKTEKFLYHQRVLRRV